MKISTLIIGGAVASVMALASCSSRPAANQAAEVLAEMDASDILVGDTIIKSDDVTVTTSMYIAKDGMEALQLILVTDNATSVTDTTLVDSSYFQISSNDPNNIQLSLGVDTANYDLTSLPAIIRPMEQIVLPETLPVNVCEKFNFGKVEPDFDLSSYFMALVFVRNHPKHDVTMFLTRSLQNSLLEMFDDNEIDTIAPEMNVRQATDFLKDQFEKASRNRAGDSEFMANYYFGATYYPDWQSADENLVTYHLINELYFGGAHGQSNGIYVTFDVKRNKALDIADIFTPEGFDKAVQLLTEQVKTYTEGRITSADLGEQCLSDSPGYYVNYNGKFYPRPALTPHGVAFAYQPYDIAPFSEGIIYFLIPYSQLEGSLKAGLM